MIAKIKNLVNNFKTDSEQENDPGEPPEVGADEVDISGLFPQDGGWGHRITISDYEKSKVHGHISPRVSDGDRFAYQMNSGRVAVFELEDVDNCTDPKDQFFASFFTVGYLKEGDEDKL